MHDVHCYHSFQNHYTHKIIIFKLFRSLQLQFSGPTGIYLGPYSCSFVGLTGICLYGYSSLQLHKKWSSELFSENCSYSYIKNGFRITLKTVTSSNEDSLISFFLSDTSIWRH